MEKIQLVHPGGKKAPTMEKTKYETLSASLLACLKRRKQASFGELADDVAADLEKKKVTPAGKLEWNLAWICMDLEAQQLIRKDRTVSPAQFTPAR